MNILSIIDKAATGWQRWRVQQHIKNDPILSEKFEVDHLEYDKRNIEIILSHPVIPIIAEEACAILREIGAPNYVQFDAMPRLDRGIRPIRVTVQYADGESPATQNARLREEVASLTKLRKKMKAIMKRWFDASAQLSTTVGEDRQAHVWAFAQFTELLHEEGEE